LGRNGGTTVTDMFFAAATKQYRSSASCISMCNRMPHVSVWHHLETGEGQIARQLWVPHPVFGLSASLMQAKRWMFRLLGCGGRSELDRLDPTMMLQHAAGHVFPLPWDIVRSRPAAFLWFSHLIKRRLQRLRLHIKS